jgi:hypothetical protein
MTVILLCAPHSTAPLNEVNVWEINVRITQPYHKRLGSFLRFLCPDQCGTTRGCDCQLINSHPRWSGGFALDQRNHCFFQGRADWGGGVNTPKKSQGRGAQFLQRGPQMLELRNVLNIWKYCEKLRSKKF